MNWMSRWTSYFMKNISGKCLKHPTGGMVRWLKIIEEDNDTCQHLHRILRWLKIQTIHFSLQNIDHVFVCRNGSLFSSKIPRSLKIQRDIDQNQMHMLARVIVSFDDFLTHLTISYLKTNRTRDGLFCQWIELEGTKTWKLNFWLNSDSEVPKKLDSLKQYHGITKDLFSS